MRETAFTIENPSGEPVRCDLRLPDGDGPFPVAIVLHGFKGFKNWGMFPPTARRIAERGVATVAINTSRNGVGRDPLEFTELELFARNTPGHEATDVRCVIDVLEDGTVEEAAGVSGVLDPKRLGILGHSFGGGVALLVASNDERLRCVVTWAAISTFHRTTERAIAEWRSSGRLEIPNLRTGQILWQDLEVLEDREVNRQAYDLQAACGRIRVPLLCVHGEQDEAVEAESAGRLVSWAASTEKRAMIVPHTGHTFGAVHPWKGPTPAWETAVNAASDWFAAHL